MELETLTQTIINALEDVKARDIKAVSYTHLKEILNDHASTGSTKLMPFKHGINGCGQRGGRGHDR